MAATARPPLVVGADGLSQNLQSGDALLMAAYTVAGLPTGTGIKAGALAYATNGRAITGVAILGGGFTTQAAGAGTGCLVTWSGAAWQIAGTATTVSA